MAARSTSSTRPTRHFLAMEDGRVIGYSRLLPTTRPHLLSDVMPQLCEGDAAARHRHLGMDPPGGRPVAPRHAARRSTRSPSPSSPASSSGASRTASAGSCCRCRPSTCSTSSSCISGPGRSACRNRSAARTSSPPPPSSTSAPSRACTASGAHGLRARPDLPLPRRLTRGRKGPAMLTADPAAEGRSPRRARRPLHRGTRRHRGDRDAGDAAAHRPSAVRDRRRHGGSFGQSGPQPWSRSPESERVDLRRELSAPSGHPRGRRRRGRAP